ncbi:MAG: TetR family transcriptional regulator, partial [Ruminococcus sp.]|nr:TetR family transcriptional regulator [Ruminococcus sp.]
MGEAERTTLERIQAAARREFTEKGFRAASLRNIVKAA